MRGRNASLENISCGWTKEINGMQLFSVLVLTRAIQPSQSCISSRVCVPPQCFTPTCEYFPRPKSVWCCTAISMKLSSWVQIPKGVKSSPSKETILVPTCWPTVGIGRPDDLGHFGRDWQCGSQHAVAHSAVAHHACMACLGHAVCPSCLQFLCEWFEFVGERQESSEWATVLMLMRANDQPEQDSQAIWSFGRRARPKREGRKTKGHGRWLAFAKHRQWHWRELLS